MAQHVFHDSIVRICAGMEAFKLKPLIEPSSSNVKQLWGRIAAKPDLEPALVERLG